MRSTNSIFDYIIYKVHTNIALLVKAYSRLTEKENSKPNSNQSQKDKSRTDNPQYQNPQELGYPTYVLEGEL